MRIGVSVPSPEKRFSRQLVFRACHIPISVQNRPDSIHADNPWAGHMITSTSRQLCGQVSVTIAKGPAEAVSESFCFKKNLHL